MYSRKLTWKAKGVILKHYYQSEVMLIEKKLGLLDARLTQQQYQ